MFDKLTVAEFIKSGFCPRGQSAFLMSKTAQDYSGFVEALYCAIDSAVAKLCESRHILLRDVVNENLLTVQITNALSHMGFDATFDTATNGHCDITVRDPRGYQWLGEAKIHKESYSWLFEGYLQLSTRYATGIANQDHGGLIIYVYIERSDLVMNRWIEHLKEQRGDIAHRVCKNNRQCCFTEDVAAATGDKMTIRHIPVPMFFKPAA